MTEAVSAPAGAPTRAPQQGRSRASFERMMDAAERLMRDRSSDDFTLNEVSKLGKVSIGSIYCRFDSKDDMMRAVQARVLQRVEEDQLTAVSQAREQAGNLPDLISRLVENMAETLSKHAPALRPLMLRATADEMMAKAGAEGYRGASQLFFDAVLEYRGEIAHPDPDHAARATFDIFYAAVARFLGFGSPAGFRQDVMRWHQLKEDLSLMCTAFLMTDLKAYRSR